MRSAIKSWTWALFWGALLGPLVVGAEEPGQLRSGEITADAIRLHTTVLGSDGMQGRAPGSVGGRRAAGYLRRTLDEMGLRPFGDAGGYDQRVPLHASLALEESRFEIWNLGSTRRLRLGDDYLLATAGSETLIPRRAPMVFVGYGIVAPEFDYNDYLGIDVRGKVVVFLAGEPPSDDPEYFQGSAPTIYSAPATKAKIALTRGAAGSLMMPEPRTGLERAWEAARRDYSIESLGLAYSLPEHLTAILHPQVGRWLLTDALYDLDAILEMAERGTLRSFHLPTEMSFVGRFRQRDVVASNLVAVIDGVDPELRSSFVVALAHYDHLGIGPAEDGDGIYNGVVDNALGVSCLLEIAGALSTTRPTRRSVIVLFTTAEEAGLLGARSFLADPPVPAARMAAAVNIDGLAFLDDFEDLVAIGGELSDLGRRLEWAARRIGLEVSRPPDAVWDRAAYVRGDQLAFAEAGVPSVLVNEGFRWPGRSREEALAAAFAWMAEIYHSPRDDLDQPLDFDAAARHCGAILELIVAIADDPEAPKWNPRSPYAYERALSIALDR